MTDLWTIYKIKDDANTDWVGTIVLQSITDLMHTPGEHAKSHIPNTPS